MQFMQYPLSCPLLRHFMAWKLDAHALLQESQVICQEVEKRSYC